MNRADRRRQSKLEKSAAKNGVTARGASIKVIDQAIAGMIQPIVTLLNAERFDEAEQGLLELLAANPDHPEGLHLYGLLLCQTGREAQGIEKLRRATLLAPQTSLYWNNFAAALSRAGLSEESLTAARQAVALDPGYSDARRNLANMLLSTGDISGGVAELERLTKTRPADATLWHQLAQYYANQKQFETAETAYKRVLNLEPENTRAMRDLAALYTDNWQYDAAQRLRRQADQLDKTGNI